MSSPSHPCCFRCIPVSVLLHFRALTPIFHSCFPFLPLPSLLAGAYTCFIAVLLLTGLGTFWSSSVLSPWGCPQSPYIFWYLTPMLNEALHYSTGRGRVSPNYKSCACSLGLSVSLQSFSVSCPCCCCRPIMSVPSP